MFIFHRPEIQNKSRNRPQSGATDLPSEDPCLRQLVQDKQQLYPKGGKAGARWDPALPWPPRMSPQIINSHFLKPQVRRLPCGPREVQASGKACSDGTEPKGIAFHRRKQVPKHGWGDWGWDGASPGDTVFLSIHQILMLSLLSWGEYWLVPLLQSP